MKRLVCGVGINDVGYTEKDKKNKTYIYYAYSLWERMLRRCYVKYKNSKTYFEVCAVCPRWRIFSNFLADLPSIPNYDLWLNNRNKGISLDKDILGGQHKYYSPNYCMFTTKHLNTQESNKRTKSYQHIIQPKAIIVSRLGKEMYFSSIAACHAQLHIHKRDIYKCLCGEKASHNRYFFKYKEVA